MIHFLKFELSKSGNDLSDCIGALLIRMLIGAEAICIREKKSYIQVCLGWPGA
jgi:hypothetical protein